MAGAFGCDPQVAGQVAGELARVRSDMGSTARAFDGYEQVTGSRRVAAALDRFFAESSDNREKMERLLERASGLLGGLAEGTVAVDRGLAGALAPADRSPGAGTPSGEPVPDAAGGRR
jgi:hypothetical protein